MNKAILFLFAFILFANFSLAQNVKPMSKHFYSICYFGEKIFHPGLQLSVNNSFYLSKDITNQKNRFDVGLSTSGYFHFKNHFGLRVTPNLSLIHCTKKGFEYGLKADAGFMRRFYQGSVFEVNDNGNVERKYLSGQNAFTYGLYVLLAKNWYISKSKNIRFSVEIGGFQETNYNESVLLHPAINFGISKYFTLKK
jgi:hypothetical protein